MKTLPFFLLLLFSCAIDETLTPKATFPGNSKFGRSHNKHYPKPPTVLTIAFGETELQDYGQTTYLLKFHVVGSTAAEDWISVNSGELYIKGRAKIDSTLAVIPKPDVIRFIWSQGNSDGNSLEWAQNYGENEAWLFNLLDAEYGFNQIINYIPEGQEPYLDIVIQGKEQNAGGNAKIKLIYPTAYPI